MEEVDEILLKDLREVGCAIPEEYKSTKDFKADILIAAVLKCLRIVDKERDYPRNIPKNNIQKVNQSTQLVNRISELGYTNELSYHQLMYPNEADTRRILMWFQDKLPKPDERPSSGDANRASLVNKAIDDEIAYLVSDKNIWTPDFINAPAARHQRYWGATSVTTADLYTPSTPVYFKGFQRKTPEMERYFDAFMPLVTEQPTRDEDLAPSVFEYNIMAWTEQQERDAEWNTSGLESGLNPMQFLERKKKGIREMMVSALRSSLDKQGMTKKFVRARAERTGLQRTDYFEREGQEVVATTETEEEIERRREQERLEADARYKAVVDEFKETEQKIISYTNEIRQLKAAIIEEQGKTESLKTKYLQLKTVMDLLPDAANNIAKLKKLAQEKSEKIKELATQWEQVRQPLVESYRKIRDKLHDREQDAKVQLEKIKEMRAKMKDMIEEINKKEEKYKQLLELYKTLPKDNRSNYTRRILEMVKNVKKQIVEINKILIDTKNLQKEINSVTETLNRSFAVSEELIFQDASKGDMQASTAYKKLVAMNEAFNSLVETVEQTGQAKNDSLTLEENIATIQARTSSLSMENIEKDLKQVRDENAKLIKKLRAVALETGENVLEGIPITSEAPASPAQAPGAGQSANSSPQPKTQEPAPVEEPEEPSEPTVDPLSSN